MRSWTSSTTSGGTPDLHIGVISSDMGAGDDSIDGCDADGGDRGRLHAVQTPVRRRPDDGAIPAPCSEATGRRSSRTTLATCCRGRSPASRCSAKRVRLRAAVRVACSTRWIPRWRPREPGLPAARGVPGRHHGHQRGRLLRQPRRPALRHHLEPDRHVARSDRRRTSAATSSGTCAAGAHPPRTATGELSDCESNETEGYLESGRPSPPFFVGSRAIPRRCSSPASRARRRHTRCTSGRRHRRHGRLARDWTVVHDRGRRVRRSCGSPESADPIAGAVRPLRGDLRGQHVHAAAADRRRC